ncbi:MAG: glycosyltransferase, partial [Pseudomonadota bacterium]
FSNLLFSSVLKLVLIDQLVPGEPDVSYKIEVYGHNDFTFRPYRPAWWMTLLMPWLKLTNRNGTQIPFKIRDFLSVIDWSVRDKTRFDYFIGLESVNTMAGIFLRALGRVKCVIYYVSDYSPNRYANGFLNSLYLAFDRFCALRADYIWDVSKAIQIARIEKGLNPAVCAPVIHVANGLFPDQIGASKNKRRNRHSLVYMGTVGVENGPDVAIEALALVRNKYKDAMLHMIGGKPSDFAWLLPIIQKRKLTNAVVHHGFVPKAADMMRIMNTCSVGLAPYRAYPGSARWYGDAGKLRAYSGAGLATVSSHVPPLGAELAANGAAVIARDNATSFARAIVGIFDNRPLREKLCANATRFASTNTWEHQFSTAFEKMRLL